MNATDCEAEVLAVVADEVRIARTQAPVVGAIAIATVLSGTPEVGARADVVEIAIGVVADRERGETTSVRRILPADISCSLLCRVSYSREQRLPF